MNIIKDVIEACVGSARAGPLKLVENGNAVADAVKGEKPAGARGVYIKRCSVSTTMGISLKVDIRD